ncbi:hypothetical protein CIRG_05225 [Coccidioides immitis RMSCC 2394]|uniref:Uncharacterized protein n=1 Tax=Coccidioides immitis RMSCC 2394 TaxID=404692 RepID=A0A0J6YEV5_COCIT|nr:hypothetical protein CIRG_05225 [Coccidioides immitis RMSCC 2394]
MYGPPNAERKIYYYRIRKTGWREKRKVKKKKKATISEREACFLRVKRSRREENAQRPSGNAQRNQETSPQCQQRCVRGIINTRREGEQSSAHVHWQKGEEKWEQRNGAEWQSSSLCQDVQVPRRRALGKPPLNSWGERHFAPLPLLGPVARALPFCDALRVFGTELAASTREREGSGGRWRRRERVLLSYDYTP